MDDIIYLSRDCDATVIPHGIKTHLLANTPVRITQSLGGYFTVEAQGALFRIEGRDADALGIKDFEAQEHKVTAKQISHGPIDEKRVWDKLRECYDPEIPINIVDLGLVYGCEIKENKIFISMTLTAPGCGMGDFIAEDVRQKVLTIENVNDVSVQIVFDPPWRKEMMSESAKLEANLFY